MPYLIAFVTFLTVTLAVYGAMSKSVLSPVEARLGGLRYTRPGRQAVVDPDSSFQVRVLRPMMKGLGKRANGVLPSTMEQKLQGLIQKAGLKIAPGQFILVVALLAGVAPLILAMMMIAGGQSMKIVLMFWGAMVFGGLYIPPGEESGAPDFSADGRARLKALWPDTPAWRAVSERKKSTTTSKSSALSRRSTWTALGADTTTLDPITSNARTPPFCPSESSSSYADLPGPGIVDSGTLQTRAT